VTRRPQRLAGADAETVADVMFALSAPRRLEILSCLDEGPLTVTQIVDAIQMEQSAVSHQLRVLREHDLVKSERDGKRRLYALYDDAVSELLDAARRHVARREKGGSHRERVADGH
jgi:DNA-binding transcriptional ArsR family regulator